MKSKILIVAAFAILMFTGCCSTCQQRAKNQLPLCKTEWHLVQIEGVDKDLKSDSFNIVLNESGHLSGVAACNRLLGTYQTDENKSLRFVNVGSTMMICPENEDLERKFLEVLNVVTHYDIDGDVLMLLSEGSIKALLKGKAVECHQGECGDCDHSCDHKSDCKKGDCDHKGECKKECDHKHDCKKECDKVADCKKAAECQKSADCTKKAECKKTAECQKSADCTKKAECKKATECKKGACPKA
ncbi:MAG: META domain-containing protein [Alistipes sp.]|nr:META domain-containing protein [Alistipes sp.]